ncbi:pheromone-processing carboxypeptidase KEX1-like isoform X3 [Vicia villosa]|uniref:pheromone-processing carboxypeptidase KEX1-like isoform X3 n=1 Tax=Vicia villosa TaxID=3911 RepID=UPI00273AEE4C|nr:pheromone-processing carboxypeptidase KEX1-like isoform X3 [Vicia villosa]
MMVRVTVMKAHVDDVDNTDEDDSAELDAVEGDDDVDDANNGDEDYSAELDASVGDDDDVDDADNSDEDDLAKLDAVVGDKRSTENLLSERNVELESVSKTDSLSQIPKMLQT